MTDTSATTDCSAAAAVQRVLPASPNWFCSQVCDWTVDSSRGVLLVAFGAKDGVFVYEIPEDGTTDGLRFRAHVRRGRRDQRVTALRLLAERGGELRLLCGGEEGGVQLWDAATRALVAQQRKHGGAEVSALAAADAALVVAGDLRGRISVWKRDEESVTVFTPVAGDAVFAMATAPHDAALVAVGYRSGVLCLVDALRGAVRHRLDGHDQEVQCVTWRLAAGGDALLASSSRDRSIKVWRVQVTAQATAPPSMERVLALPKPKQASSYSQSKRLWLPVAWSYGAAAASSKLRLWSGSFDGNLLAWEWKDGAEPSACKPVVVKNGHNRLLFNIVSLPREQLDAPSLLTISLDRELRVWREGVTSAALTCHDRLPGLGGHVYGVAYSGSREVIAAGVGDQTIRLWSVSAKASEKSWHQAELLWKGLQSKITCVAWNPFESSMLAYGTEDGVIGVFDVEARRSVRFKTAHSSQVQRLQWRAKPQPRTSESHSSGDTASDGTSSSSFVQAMLALESAQADGRSLEDALREQDTAGGADRGASGSELQVVLWSQDVAKQVLESNPSKPEAPSRTPKALATCSCFSWNARGDRLAVGRENGVVEVLVACVGSSSSEELVVAQSFHEHEQPVVCVAWTSSAAGDALASGGRDGRIVVFRVGEESRGLGSGGGAPSIAPSTLERGVLGVFTGHSNAITSLRWNTSSTSSDSDVPVLASSSLDGTVQVWSVASRAQVNCFCQHVGRVFSVDWIGQFALVSGGEDQTIRVWDYRELTNEVVPTPAAKAARAHASDKMPSVGVKSAQHGGDEEQSSSSVTAAKNPGKAKKKAISVGIFRVEVAPAPLETSLEQCRQQLDEHFGDQQAGGERITARLHECSRDSGFAAQEHALAAAQDWDRLAQAYLMEGKIGDALRVVAKEDALDASWLAFAPMAGLEVWRELTNVYALQLESRGDWKSAALHFVSIGKARAAVKCFVSGSAFREAIALIRSRLGPHDPLLRTTLLAYAAHLEKQRRFGEAAQTLLETGTAAAASRAAVLLVKTGDLHAFEAALDVLASLERQRHPIGETVAGAAATPAAEDSNWSVPSSLAFEIIRSALLSSRFSLAERASEFIGAGAARSSSTPSTSTRLTRCFLGVLSALASHESGTAEPEQDELLAAWPAHLPADSQAFLSYLMQSGKRSYCDGRLWFDASSAEASADPPSFAARSKRVWDKVLAVCRANGIWVGEAFEDDVAAAQELLMDQRYFANLVQPAGGATTGSAGDDSSLLTLAMNASHCLLQFLLDVMNGYLLSGLERVRETLERSESSAGVADARVVDLRLRLLSLFFPSGLVDPESPPHMGELAVEARDTSVLWRALLLLQCRTLVGVARVRRDVEQLSSSLKRLLEEELAAREEAPADGANAALRDCVRAEIREVLASRDDDAASEDVDVVAREKLPSSGGDGDGDGSEQQCVR